MEVKETLIKEIQDLLPDAFRIQPIQCLLHQSKDTDLYSFKSRFSLILMPFPGKPGAMLPGRHGLTNVIHRNYGNGKEASNLCVGNPTFNYGKGKKRFSCIGEVFPLDGGLLMGDTRIYFYPQIRIRSIEKWEGRSNGIGFN